jgi:4-amino-4-deoxy-L-arabinose transferase-like glycosyltransferase
LSQIEALRKKNSEKFLVVAIASVAALVRVWRTFTRIDYYGDSYHHWLISYLTATNSYIYTDFKPNTMNIVWLPLYHYINAFLMNISGIYDLAVPHSVNIVAGSLTCILVYKTARLSLNRTLAMAAGLSLAVQPWFIEINSWGVTETLAALLIISAIYFYFKGNPAYTSISIALSMLTRYEGWVFASMLLFAAVTERRWRRRQYVLYLVACLSVVLSWFLWSYLNTSDFMAWYRLQSTMLRWDMLFLGGQQRLDLDNLTLYPRLALDTTSYVFLIGLAACIVKKPPRRNAIVLALVELAYILMISFQHSLGFALLHPRHLVYVFPITATLCFQILERIDIKKISHILPKKIALSILIVILIAMPTVIQIDLFKPKTYLIEYEMDAGLELRRIYRGGNVICDSPAVIYYSQLDPRSFYSSNYLFWYSGTWNKVELQEWLNEHHIVYLVWQNVSYSATWWLLPELAQGKSLRIDRIEFKLMYKSSTGLPPIYVYEIILPK